MNNGFSFKWDEETDKKLLGKIFSGPIQFANGLKNSDPSFLQSTQSGNFSNYESPFFESFWQNYYMDDLIALLIAKESANYNTYVYSFTESKNFKLKFPERKKAIGLTGGNDNKDIGRSFTTVGIIDQSERANEIYNIYIVTSKDGVGLRDYFNMGIVRSNDLVFFLEDNTGDISEPVLLCKMGDNWKKRFKAENAITNTNTDIIDKINAAIPIDAKKFNELINKGEIKGYPWLDSADSAGKAMYYSLYFVNYWSCYAISKILEVLIEGLEKLKIPEEGWLPSAENFEPALIGNGVTKFTKQTIEVIVDSCKANLKSIENLIDGTLKSDSIAGAFVKKLVGGFLLKAKAFLQQLEKELDILKEILLEVADFGNNILNAYLCGVVNGFVDAIIGLATLIKWLFETGITAVDILKDMKNKLPAVLEALDNMLLAWEAFSFAKVFKALGTAITKFVRDVFNELGGGMDEKMLYRMAYFAGNVVGFLIEFVLELLVTGGVAAITKIFTGLAELGEKIAATLSRLVEKFLNISLKEIGKDLLGMLAKLTAFFKATGEQLAVFFTKLFEELKAIFGIGLKPETEAVFERLGLEWSSKRIPTLNVGVNPLGENVWGVYHKGVVVKQGTKKEIEEFAEKLKGMGDNAAEKYLDELFEAKRIVKTAYGESEFSKQAIEYRRKLINPKHKGNIAIFEYTDNFGNVIRQEFATLSKKEFTELGLTQSPHAEILGMEWLEKNKIPFENVKTVYSELEPCQLEGAKCKEKLLRKCKNARLEYSFEYPGTNLTNKEIRRASIKSREKILQKIIL